MILRRLDQSNLRIRKAGDQVLEPSRVNHIVGIDDADDLGVCSGLRHRDPQCCSLESLEILDTNKLEALAKLAATAFDRLPESRIRRIVDDDDTLEIRIVELRHRVDSTQQHFRWLPIGGDVN